MKKQKSPLIRLLSVATLIAALVFQNFLPGIASADQIVDRKLTLMAGATDGGTKPGGVVVHKFNFTLPGGGNVGSVKFEYCTLAAGACIMPTGLVTTSATLDAQSGATGFIMVNATNGAPYLTRTAANVGANTAVSYTLGSVTNPTTPNETFFVRITSYLSENATTGADDAGTVAAATATQIILDGTMPESLVFCAGGTVSKTVGVPDCTTVTAGIIHFNQLFSPTASATSRSQMAASTNAGAGYVITVNGPTLTSGSNTVTAMGIAGPGVLGTSQFGMNLKLNTTTSSTPLVGAEIDPVSDDTNWKGQSLTGYNTADVFKFVSGDAVADSASGGAGGSDAQIYTASYIVNVRGNQPAGTYTTTLTYICTPTF